MERNFYNAKGDVVRAYELAKGDVIEVSAEGFDKTPVVKKTVSADATGKFKLGE